MDIKKTQKDVIQNKINHGWEIGNIEREFELLRGEVEEAYDAWHDRIAVLGGFDINFMCTKTPEEIAARTRAMLERTQKDGGWAVGTGNSVPDYIPFENYIAMIKEAIGYDPMAQI